ncbi:MAG: hypothetical protein ABSB76_38500 [Streptosporangiaceae bacterium]|jgi:hypothetical protein
MIHARQTGSVQQKKKNSGGHRPDEAEAQALFAKARELAAKDPGQRPDAAISTADSFRASFPPSPPGQLRCLVRHRRAGRLADAA